MEEQKQVKQVLVVEEVVHCLGLTKTWLAMQLGVTISQVTRILNGERVWTERNRGLAAAALGWRGEYAAELFEAVSSDGPVNRVVVNARYGWAQGHVTAEELGLVEGVFA